jgi:hypothetical protein
VSPVKYELGFYIPEDDILQCKFGGTWGVLNYTLKLMFCVLTTSTAHTYCCLEVMAVEHV